MVASSCFVGSLSKYTVVHVKIKENIHNCGRGFKGVIKIVRRPVGIVKFCEFCGKEFSK